MARRRTWMTVGVAAVLVAVGVAAWIAAAAGPLRPLHFWVRTGQDPARLYESPGGPEITTWATFEREQPDTLDAVAKPTSMERLAVAVGLVRESQDKVIFQRVHRSDAPAGWCEYIVVFSWSRRDPPADPRLAGRWRAEGAGVVEGEEDLVLGEDGTARGVRPARRSSSDRWGCIGDVVVFWFDDSSHWSVDQAAFVASDGETLQWGVHGEDERRTFRRVP